jgi:hypothetical protein
MRNKAFLFGASWLLVTTLSGCNTPVKNQQSSASSSASQPSNSSTPPSPPPGPISDSSASGGSLRPSLRNGPTKPSAPEDEGWYSKNPGWYENQLKQDCPDTQQDQKAIEAVLRAYRGDKGQFRFGEKDPFNRKPDTLSGFKSRPNTLGEGTIISAYKDNERGADYSRRRSVWLVLDGKVYPLNTNAAGNVGVLFDSPPSSILKRVGLKHSYTRGETMLDQLGFDEFIYVRKFAGSSPFPVCQ